MESSSHKCCFGFEVLPWWTWLAIAFWNHLWNQPGVVPAGRCMLLVFCRLASGRFVRTVWRILWRCTLELFAAVILSHVQSSSCTQKPPPLMGALPAEGFLIIPTGICSDWYARNEPISPPHAMPSPCVCFRAQLRGRWHLSAHKRRFDILVLQQPGHSSAGACCPQMRRDKGKYLFTLKMARTHPARRPVHMPYVLAETDRYNCMHMQTWFLSLIWRHSVGVGGPGRWRGGQARTSFNQTHSDTWNIFILCQENNSQNMWIERGPSEHLGLSRVCVSAAQGNKTLLVWCWRLWNVPERFITESGSEPGSSRFQFRCFLRTQLCLSGNFYFVNLCDAVLLAPERRPRWLPNPAGRPLLSPPAPLGHPARRFVSIFIKSVLFVIRNMCPCPRVTIIEGGKGRVSRLRNLQLIRWFSQRRTFCGC